MTFLQSILPARHSGRDSTSWQRRAAAVVGPPLPLNNCCKNDSPGKASVCTSTISEQRPQQVVPRHRLEVVACGQPTRPRIQHETTARKANVEHRTGELPAVAPMKQHSQQRNTSRTMRSAAAHSSMPSWTRKGANKWRQRDMAVTCGCEQRPDSSEVAPCAC